MNLLHTLIPSLAVALAVAGCSGGDPVSSVAGSDPTTGCDGRCASATTKLTKDDVERVLAQGIGEARSLGVKATLAVVDRVGNVLAVYRMGSAAEREVLIASAVDAGGKPAIDAGLEGIRLPLPSTPLNLDHQAAIAKAITGAYLSSEGNAFSTRTASQIVQEHFNPGEQFQPGGPLFGVQFSQLPCSDFSLRDSGPLVGPGPHRSPLGLSADPGGFPLYKSGTVVGGVGVMADGRYGLDPVITDRDRDIDELIALAASFGFAAPPDRRADRISVDGKLLRFSDVDFSDLASQPEKAGKLASLPAGTGALIPVSGYFSGTLRAGTAFGEAESGIRPAKTLFSGRDAFVFVDASDTPRFAPRAGTDAASLGSVAPLKASEVGAILDAALDVANRARGQIRRPLGSPARVTISVVDTNGEILGMARSRDAPVFGADVSLQKARTAAFFSTATAAAFLQGLPDAAYLDGAAVGSRVKLSSYVTAVRDFLGDNTALASGAVAFSDRAGGNMSRPFFPDGIDGNPPGPFSKPPGQWSPFSTGLQLDLSINGILQHVLHVGSGGALPDVGQVCAGVDLDDSLAATATVTAKRLANGLQIFPGSVPIYRGNVLVGGIGVSGDGVDQDDMIAFLGIHNAGASLAGAFGNAPVAIRADNLTPKGIRLRFIQCPQSPFLNSSADNVCAGK